jgi:hypothetical protein
MLTAKYQFYALSAPLPCAYYLSGLRCASFTLFDTVALALATVFQQINLAVLRKAASSETG